MIDDDASVTYMIIVVLNMGNGRILTAVMNLDSRLQTLDWNMPCELLFTRVLTV